MEQSPDKMNRVSIKLSGNSMPGREPISAKAEGPCLVEERRGLQCGGWNEGSSGQARSCGNLMLKYNKKPTFKFFLFLCVKGRY